VANRYWTTNKQRNVSAKGHGAAYGRDGGKVLNDTETQPKYNASIGPDGPDLNVVGFPTVKAFVKAKFMLFDNMDSGVPGVAVGESVNGQVVGPGESGTSGTNWSGIGKAINDVSKKVGSALDEAGKKPDTGPRTVEPGRNGGSAAVQTDFSPVVRRSRQG